MKKRVTVTLDGDVVDFLQEKAPRKVSVSEVISWIVKATFKDIKAGRQLSSEELQEWMDSTTEGRDFRDRLREHWGPALRPVIEKIDSTVSNFKNAVKLGRKKKK